MERLAFIAVTDSAGKELAVPAADIASVHERTGGSTIVMRGGGSHAVSDTVATVFAAIDNLWTEYCTALGDPA